MSVSIGNINHLLENYLSSKNYSSITVITDQHTKKYCYPIIKEFLPKHKNINIKAGEEYKNIETCQTIWENLTQNKTDRHGLVINLGGGVIGDMGGFCASTYKRGIDFIQIPTTLLAQVDASVGGKLGVDFMGFKNHIGIFTQPKTVLVDSVFLKTLPYAELRSGYAEVIKHCLIRDKEQWDKIRLMDLEDLSFDEIIAHSIGIKNEIVSKDSTEQGLRKILNFGHTIGHAAETHFLKTKRILHGEAIAVGMICESYIAYKKKMISEDELNQIEDYLFTTFGRIKIVEGQLKEIALLTQQDKKNKGKQVLASLLNGIGNCKFDIPLTEREIIDSLQYYIVK